MNVHVTVGRNQQRKTRGSDGAEAPRQNPPKCIWADWPGTSSRSRQFFFGTSSKFSAGLMAPDWPVSVFWMLSNSVFAGTHPGDLLHLRKDQDDRHAHEPHTPPPVERLRLRWVWDGRWGRESSQTYGWRYVDVDGHFQGHFIIRFNYVAVNELDSELPLANFKFDRNF